MLSVPMQNGPVPIKDSFTNGSACRRSHILPTAACLAWLVPDLSARSKVPSLHVLINHSRYTSRARTATITIHTTITRFWNNWFIPTVIRVALTSWPKHFSPELHWPVNKCYYLILYCSTAQLSHWITALCLAAPATFILNPGLPRCGTITTLCYQRHYIKRQCNTMWMTTF